MGSGALPSRVGSLEPASQLQSGAPQRLGLRGRLRRQDRLRAPLDSTSLELQTGGTRSYAISIASADLSYRVERLVGYPPLCEMDDLQRREFHEALLEADTFGDLPGKWQAGILEAEENRPRLRVVTGD